MWKVGKERLEEKTLEKNGPLALFFSVRTVFSVRTEIEYGTGHSLGIERTRTANTGIGRAHG
jgi:hypothetical protein